MLLKSTCHGQNPGTSMAQLPLWRKIAGVTAQAFTGIPFSWTKVLFCHGSCAQSIVMALGLGSTKFTASHLVSTNFVARRYQ